MSFHTRGKINVKPHGTLIVTGKFGSLAYLTWEYDSDYRALCYLARFKYKIKSKKKRIMKKYLTKLVNDAIRLKLKEEYNND